MAKAKKTTKAKAAKKSTASPRRRSTREPEPPETPDNENEAADRGAGESEEEEPLATPATPRRKPGRPRQARLPQMEDAAIEELETIAENYREALDARMEALKEEVELKDDLLKAMKKHGKEKYFHAGVSIEVVNSKDKVKVRINKDGD
jgi:hypothetical protein